MYFITQVEEVEHLKDFDDITEYDEETRTVGFFNEFEDAVEVVVSNKMLSYEEPMNYVVIEHIPEGVQQRSQIIQWYRYNKVKEKYEPIEDFGSVVVNFTMIG